MTKAAYADFSAWASESSAGSRAVPDSRASGGGWRPSLRASPQMDVVLGKVEGTVEGPPAGKVEGPPAGKVEGPPTGNVEEAPAARWSRGRRASPQMEGKVASVSNAPAASAKRAPLRFSRRGATPLVDVAEACDDIGKDAGVARPAFSKGRMGPRASAMKADEDEEACIVSDELAVHAADDDEEACSGDDMDHFSVGEGVDEEDEDEIGLQHVEQVVLSPPDSACWDWPLSRHEKIVRVHDLDKKILKQEVIGLQRRISISSRRTSIASTSISTSTAKS